MKSLYSRVLQKSRRIRSSALYRRGHSFALERPIISFSFDDFPVSAGTTAAEILEGEGIKATYYVSVGLLGTTAPTGEICREHDLVRLKEEGHEIGCHTYAHCHSWDTSPAAFLESVEKNLDEIRRILPGHVFDTLSYPICGPKPGTKRLVASRFRGCRGGGHRVNHGRMDLNHLSAFFLEKTKGDVDPVKRIIDQNAELRSWLVFATHDVDSTPTPYGCTPRFFREVVEYAQASGAEVLPVSAVLKKLLGDRDRRRGGALADSSPDRDCTPPGSDAEKIQDCAERRSV